MPAGHLRADLMALWNGDGWRDGLMDSRMDGVMDRWTDGRTGG